jgi:hypothetical protein
MKNLLLPTLLLIFSFCTLAQEQNPCYSVADYQALLQESNPPISYQLITGWNNVGYTGTADNNGIVTQLNQSLTNNATAANTFQVIKDVTGQFWSAAFAQISTFTPGEGYMMYVVSETAPVLSFNRPVTLPLIEGCTDCASEFFNPWASQDDGSCFSLEGCTDENYIEYNELVIEDDGSCLNLIVSGCTYPLALNYDTAANTEDGSCVYFESEGSQYVYESDVYWPSDVSEINTGVNATYLIQSANIDDTPVIFGYVLGAFYTDDNGALQCGGFTNASSTQLAIMGDDTTTEDKDGFDEGETITWLAYAIDDSLIYNATVSFITTPPYGSNTYSTNGLNIITEFNIIASTPIALACPYDVYIEYSSTATEYNVSECITLVVEGCTSDLYFEYNAAANREDGTCLTLIVEGCTDNAYLEYNAVANLEDGTCTDLAVWGCTSNLYIEYNTAANLDDGTCLTLIVEGCTDNAYVEYNELANTNDGSCTTLIVLGCTNPLADNYNTQANTNDGSCIIYGCMEILADNYNTEANEDDESCIYYGCINSTADNYNAEANTDDGTCIIYGCTLAAFPNYNAVATSDDFSCDMNSTDVYGCMAALFDSYNPLATIDNGLCSDILEIGSLGLGGIVFYIDETGEHGLVASLEDITEGSNMGAWGTSEGFEWGCYGSSVSGADGTAIGTGYQNTLDISSQNCQTEQGGITAAQATLNYEVGGYTDWFLPSKEELEEMYNTIGNGGSQGNIGGFETSDYPYWSSSELNNNFAWFDSFSSGGWFYLDKYSSLRVRAVRAF